MDEHLNFYFAWELFWSADVTFDGLRTSANESVYKVSGVECCGDTQEQPSSPDRVSRGGRRTRRKRAVSASVTSRESDGGRTVSSLKLNDPSGSRAPPHFLNTVQRRRG